MLDKRYFRHNVPLPDGLTTDHIYRSLRKTQGVISTINFTLSTNIRRTLPSLIQGNAFSGIISNLVTDSLNEVSPYKHNSHISYPDLVNPKNDIGLEIKATNRTGRPAKSHNGHCGWHLIACYDTEPTSGNIIFTNIKIAELIGFTEENSDWKYYGSKLNKDTKSRATETYVTTLKGTSKLRDGSVYLDTSRVDISGWRHSKDFPIPNYSPLYTQ